MLECSLNAFQTYSDIPKLAPVLSWIYETLRLYPIVGPFRGFMNFLCDRLTIDRLTHSIRKLQRIAYFQPRMVEVSRCPKEPKSLRWSLHYTIVVCTMARHLVHTEPMAPAKLWDQPLTFKPDRFLGEYDQNAFLPFSMGARGCIGRR